MTRGCAIPIGSTAVGNFGWLAVVFGAMEALDLPLREPSSQPDCEFRRFSSDGLVIVRDRIASVFIGGTLIGALDLDDDDRGPRNVLAVTLAKSDQFHLGGDEPFRNSRGRVDLALVPTAAVLHVAAWRTTAARL